MQFVEVVVTDILAAPGVERHPEPGLHGDRGLHVGTEGDAVPPDGGGAGRLGRPVPAHAQDVQGQARAQGKNRCTCWLRELMASHRTWEP